MTDDELLAGVLRRLIDDEWVYKRLDKRGELVLDGYATVTEEEMDALVRAGMEMHTDE